MLPLAEAVTLRLEHVDDIQVGDSIGEVDVDRWRVDGDRQHFFPGRQLLCLAENARTARVGVDAALQEESLAALQAHGCLSCGPAARGQSHLEAKEVIPVLHDGQRVPRLGQQVCVRLPRHPMDCLARYGGGGGG